MEQALGLLMEDGTENVLTVGGKLGWVVRGQNIPAGYTWKLTSDASGVYEVVEDDILATATTIPHHPGMQIWKFRGLKPGKGQATFELLNGNEELHERHTVSIMVVEN